MLKVPGLEDWKNRVDTWGSWCECKVHRECMFEDPRMGY
jgi:hypothetical protein